MSRRERRLARVAAALRKFQRDRVVDSWTTTGRDEHDNPAHVRVEIGEAGIAITPSCMGVLTFSPTEAGQLRAAIREASMLYLVAAAEPAPESPPARPWWAYRPDVKPSR